MQRCLIVDNSPIVRRVAKVILGDFGFEVLEAGTGSDALAMASRWSPRLILVDAGLTDMPVLDVLRHFRDNCARLTQIVYCPNSFDILDLQRAHAAGASDVLVKPFDRASILSKIDVWTSTAGAPERSSFFSRLSRSEIVRV